MANILNSFQRDKACTFLPYLLPLRAGQKFTLVQREIKNEVQLLSLFKEVQLLSLSLSKSKARWNKKGGKLGGHPFSLVGKNGGLLATVICLLFAKGGFGMYKGKVGRRTLLFHSTFIFVSIGH